MKNQEAMVKKHTVEYWIIVIVLIVAAAGLVGNISSLGWAPEYATSVIEVTEMTAEKVGRQFEGKQAEEGNAFFYVSVGVKNKSIYEKWIDSYDFSFYNIQEYNIWMGSDLLTMTDNGRFHYRDDGIFLPAGRETTMEWVLEGPVDSERITVHYYSYLGAEEQSQFTCNI